MPQALHAEFVNRMTRQLGSDWPRLAQSLDSKSPVSIRANPAKQYQGSGISVPWCSTGYYLSERPNFTLDPALHAGGYYVQEASSMLLEQVIRAAVDLDKPLTVLDLCAAPGGKSTHLISLLSAHSVLVSNEVVRSRTTILQENLIKWGQPNSIITHADPARFGAVPGLFDVVLIDAPCSGEGLFRKDDNARQEWSPEHVHHCSLRQRRILADAWGALREGGVLIYSTCTWSPDENEENLHWFAQEHPLSFVDWTAPPAWSVEKIEHKEVRGYRCYTHKVEGEGFFISAMIKHEAAPRSGTDRTPTRHVSKKKELHDWIHYPCEHIIFEQDEFCWLRSVQTAGLAERLREHMPVVSAGTLLAEAKGPKLVPAHALAVSTVLRPEAFPVIELTLDDALAYLRKDTLPHPGTGNGYHLATFHGLPLGWVHVLSNRLNNLYPTEWRIRMDIRRL
ncbi:MAG: rRNA methyltransferase [Cyclobacteriaceae bacterium]